MNKTKAVVVHTYGGPEVLQYETAPIPDTKESDQMLVRVHSAGINSIFFAALLNQAIRHGIVTTRYKKDAIYFDIVRWQQSFVCPFITGFVIIK